MLWSIGPILAALPDSHRHLDTGQVEPPRAGERQVIVEPAPDAVGHAWRNDAAT